MDDGKRDPHGLERAFREAIERRMHDWQKVDRDGAERTICRKCGCDAAETETDFGCDS